MALRDAHATSRAVPDRLRRPALVGGILIVVLAGALLVAELVFGGTGDSLPHEVPLGSTERPPARLLACTGGLSSACVGGAAERIGIPTAWISSPTGFAFGWFTAVPAPSKKDPERAFAVEHLVSPDIVLELETNVQGEMVPDGGTTFQAATPRAWAVEVTEWGDPVTEAVSLEWAKYGVVYRLFASPSRVASDYAVSTDELLRLVDEVKYEQPH